jgi:hypothetical protein
MPTTIRPPAVTSMEKTLLVLVAEKLVFTQLSEGGMGAVMFEEGFEQDRRVTAKSEIMNNICFMSPKYRWRREMPNWRFRNGGGHLRNGGVSCGRGLLY